MGNTTNVYIVRITDGKYHEWQFRVSIVKYVSDY